MVERLLQDYPNSTHWLAGTCKIDLTRLVREIEKQLDCVVPRSSPGVPIVELGRSNGVVLGESRALVIDLVVRRTHVLFGGDLPASPSELVRGGFCDPVRIFVKQEPHSTKKRSLGKLRLISSVSLVDQLVERVLYSNQNREEIAHWVICPSKPGMGLDDLSAELVRKGFEEKKNPGVLQTDLSGFDWSVKDWELELDCEARRQLCGSSRGDAFDRLSRARTWCVNRSVFCLSNGELYEQVEPGVQLSGCYTTSSSNSRIRVALAYLCGASWAVAMGDDCVEDSRANVDLYSHYGHVVKDCLIEEGDVEFCSTIFKSDGPVPKDCTKSLFRLLNQPQVTAELLAQFFYEVRHSAQLMQLVELISTHADVDSSLVSSIARSVQTLSATSLMSIGSKEPVDQMKPE